MFDKVVEALWLTDACKTQLKDLALESNYWKSEFLYMKNVYGNQSEMYEQDFSASKDISCKSLLFNAPWSKLSSLKLANV